MEVYLSPAQKHTVVRRLKIVRVYLRKVISMVEFEKPYFVIIHQTRAIRFALKKVDQILLREYLVYCVDDENSRDELKQKIHQTVAMFNKLDG